MVNTWYGGVAPGYVRINQGPSACTGCGAKPSWPCALICYDKAARRKLETNAAGKCY